MSYFVSPFNALNQLNRELNHIFDDRRLPGDEANVGWAPQVDLSESEDAFHVVADVPGVNPEEIDINLHNGLLSIRGNRDAEKEVKGQNYTRRERSRGTFIRQFNLPDSADAEAVSARSVHGVLQVTIPKAKKAQPINIAIETA